MVALLADADRTVCSPGGPLPQPLRLKRSMQPNLAEFWLYQGNCTDR